MPDSDALLPVPYLRRLDPVPERTFYVARPGIRALPSGTAAVMFFVALQSFTLFTLLWAIWWPGPREPREYAFSIGGTALIAATVIGVGWLLLRRYPGFVTAVLRSPFIRLTVTDRRVIWNVPWAAEPLLEIGRDRVLGGILGLVDARGYGHAAMIMVPGDPSADVDGNIHFDRLPDAESFVAALARM